MNTPKRLTLYLILLWLPSTVIQAQATTGEAPAREVESSVRFDEKLKAYLGPVEARARFGMNRMDVRLLRVDEIGLVTRSEGIGEQTIPLANMNGFYAIGAKTPPASLYAQLEAGEVDAALEAMRSEYYPLIPFAKVPAENTNLHSFIGVGVDLLLKAGAIDEAIWLFDQLPAPVQTGKLAPVTRDLLAAMIAEGYFAAATELALQLPFDPADEEGTAARIEIANRLRLAGSTDDARTLYSQIGDSDSRLADTARLWSLYLEVENGRIDFVESRFSDLSQPGVGTDEFSLYRLIEGRVALEQGNLNQALVAFSSGIVNGSSGAPSRPELLFFSHVAYDRYDAPSAAEAIASELKTLYPDSPWTARL